MLTPKIYMSLFLFLQVNKFTELLLKIKHLFGTLPMHQIGFSLAAFYDILVLLICKKKKKKSGFSNHLLS